MGWLSSATGHFGTTDIIGAGTMTSSSEDNRDSPKVGAGIQLLEKLFLVTQPRELLLAILAWPDWDRLGTTAWLAVVRVMLRAVAAVERPKRRYMHLSEVLGKVQASLTDLGAVASAAADRLEKYDADSANTYEDNTNVEASPIAVSTEFNRYDMIRRLQGLAAELRTYTLAANIEPIVHANSTPIRSICMSSLNYLLYLPAVPICSKSDDPRNETSRKEAYEHHHTDENGNSQEITAIDNLLSAPEVASQFASLLSTIG